MHKKSKIITFIIIVILICFTIFMVMNKASIEKVLEQSDNLEKKNRRVKILNDKDTYVSNVIEKPIFHGTTIDKLPFLIKAKSAEKLKNFILLNEVKSTLSLKGGGRMELISKSGKLDMETKLLHINEGVIISFLDTGKNNVCGTKLCKIHAKILTVNYMNKSAIAEGGFTVQTDTMNIKSEVANFDILDQSASFKGGVKVLVDTQS